MFYVFAAILAVVLFFVYVLSYDIKIYFKEKSLWFPVFKLLGEFNVTSLCISIVTVFLLIMALCDLDTYRGFPEGFYVFLRIIVFGTMICIFFNKFHVLWKVVLILNAILFNPFIQIHLGNKESWGVFDFVALFIIVSSWVYLMKTTVKFSKKYTTKDQKRIIRLLKEKYKHKAYPTPEEVSDYLSTKKYSINKNDAWIFFCSAGKEMLREEHEQFIDNRIVDKIKNRLAKTNYMELECGELFKKEFNADLIVFMKECKIEKVEISKVIKLFVRAYTELVDAKLHPPIRFSVIEENEEED